MTDLLTNQPTQRRQELSGSSPRPPSSEPARRVERPRWRDTRLLVGVLLIVLSVVLGARFIDGATQSGRWLSVTHSLPAGHVLAASDLLAVKAHLPAASAGQYFAAPASALEGKTLTRSLAAGELLAADAVSADHQQPSRVVPLVVKAGRLPAMAAGDRIDVYVLSRPTAGGVSRETRVLTNVEFIGAEVLGSGETSVQVRVAPADAVTAIAASQSERVDLVRIDGASAANPGDDGPSSAPGFGG